MKFFQEDAFSPKRLVNEEADVSEKDTVQKVISSHFSFLPTLTSIKKLGGIGVNSRNYLIETENNKFVVKWWGTTDKECINDVMSLLSHLQNSNQLVPIPVMSSTGNLMSDSEGHHFSVLSYINGKHFDATMNKMQNYLSSVSSLFFDLQQIDQTFKSVPTIQYDTKKIWDVIDIVSNKPDLISEICTIEQLSVIQNLRETVKGELEMFAQLSSPKELRLCHFDLHPKNVLIDPADNFGFLDFEACGYVDPRCALGFSLLKMLRQTVITDSEHKNPFAIGEQALNLVGGLNFDFQEEDLSLLPIFGRIEVLRRLTYILDQYLTRGDREWVQVLSIQVSVLQESYQLFSQAS